MSFHINPPDRSFYSKPDPTLIPWGQNPLLKAKVGLPRTISTLSIVPSAEFAATFSVKLWDAMTPSSCRGGWLHPFMEQKLFSLFIKEKDLLNRRIIK